jgi:hypothetical protein
MWPPSAIGDGPMRWLVLHFIQLDITQYSNSVRHLPLPYHPTSKG